MPQYYAILDNGQSKPKGAGMPRKNQNINRQGAKKVNYRMREGSNYYGDVTAGKKQASYGKAEDSRLAGKKPAAKKNPYVDDTARKMKKAPNKNYVRGGKR